MGGGFPVKPGGGSDHDTPRRFCGKDLAGAVLYAAVCRACRIGARGPKMEDPHYVETPHVLCVFFFHVVR